MNNICSPVVKRPAPAHFSNQPLARAYGVLAGGRWTHLRGSGFFAIALFAMLWVATPAKALFTIVYNGTLIQVGAGSLTPSSFSGPNGLALDLSGNLYIADTGNNRILKVAPGGTTASLFAITIAQAAATFSGPNQLAADSAGNLYIADTGNNRIVKSDPSGNGSVISTGGFALAGPQGVAVDTFGDIFVSDSGNHRIVEIPSGGSATVLATTGIALTTLTTPKGLATDTYGNLYIVDFVAISNSNNRVLKVSTSLVASTVTTMGSLGAPVSVTVSRDGIVFITDASNQRIAIHDPQGDRYDLFTDEINSEFGAPGAIVTDSSGAFYVTDTENNRVQLFHQSSADFGHVTLGSSSTPQTLNFIINGFTTVTSVAIYTAGTQNLDFTITANSGTPCVAESTGIECTVNVLFTPTSAGLRRGALVLSFTNSFLPSGNFTVPLFGIGDGPVAALSPGIASQLSTGSLPFTNAFQPFQTAYDGVGNIYATDSANNRVLAIPAGGGTATVVNIPALPSPTTLLNPTGIAIDGAGNLFVADAGHNRIVEVTAGGSSLVVPTCLVETVSPCTSYSFNNPQSLFIDGAGNLFVVDAGNQKVVQLTVAYSATDDNTLDITNAFVLATGSFSFGVDPTSSVVNTAGGFYVSDNANSRVVQVDRFGSASTVDFSSLSMALATPHSVALDPMGNLYVMDAGGSAGAQRVVQKYTSGGTSVLAFSGTAFGSAPNEIAVDNRGNVLVADASLNHLVQVNVGESAKAFPNTQQNASSAPQTTTVTNLGDQPLVFSANPAYTVNFSENTGDLNPCTSDTSLTVGLSCDVSIIFTPQSAGSLSANITITDDTQNVGGSTQQIAVSGTGLTSTIATTTTVTALPASVNVGQSVTLTATVSDSGGTPTGSVTFTDLSTSATLASNVNLISGVATLALNTLAAGAHTIQAVYTPAGNFLGSSGLTTVIVSVPPTSSVSLSSSANPSALGQAVTFTAVVTTSGGSSGAATGSVQFSDGATPLGTVSLSGGQASFTTSALTGGTHIIVARYSGDSTFPPAQASFGQIVNALVSMTVSAAPADAVIGQTVVFTAQVSATVPAGFSAPSGQVTWAELIGFAPGPTLGAAPLVSGAATLSLSSLAVGTYNILVQYSGDATWNSATRVVTVTVSRASSSTTISVGIVSGQITLTANVGPVAPGTGTPTGSVQFVDAAKNTVVATAALLGGTASAIIAAGAAASVEGRPITAVYSGDTAFSGSTSAPLPALFNAASDALGTSAAGEIVSLYGIAGLTGNTTATLPLMASLSGVSATVTDSTGTVGQALIYGVYASADQINLFLPSGIASGPAIVTITLPGGNTITTIINVGSTAPGIFTAGANGQGTFAGQVVYVHEDGSQTITSSTAPITFAAGDQVYLVLYGTGFDHASSVTAAANGASLPVTFFGAQGTYSGLDQINVGPLPANLEPGVVTLTTTVDGQQANSVTFSVN